MTVFDLYAAYYDLLYKDKDYSAEAQYVTSLIRGARPAANTILELGSGTGAHAQLLATAGFSIVGVDISRPMVERALERRRTWSPLIQSRTSFAEGDIRAHRAGLHFDAVISLFHVMSYQTTNADQDAAFATARAHLDTSGIFIFDFWYGPAVLSDRPRNVVKEVSDDRIAVRRRTTPTMYVNDNCVDVRFDVDILSRADARAERLTEVHRLRYLFLPEILNRLAGNGMSLLKAEAWSTREPLSDRSWYGCVIATVD